jgi:hypothetical protein
MIEVPRILKLVLLPIEMSSMPDSTPIPAKMPAG